MSKHKHKKAEKSPRRFVRTMVLLLLAIALFFSSMYGYRCLVEKVCELESINRMVRHDMTILMPEGALDVEVVNTELSRSLGLSGRSKLQDNEGMLFVFDHPGKYGFWMKDMNFALDIIWINQNGVVVWIEREVDPSTYPKAFINKADASYVLEINSGLSKKFGLYLGSKVSFLE